MQHPLELIHPRNLKHMTGHLRSLVEGRLWAKILVGLVLGLGVGFLLGPSLALVDPGTAEVWGNWLALPGKFFLVMIQMIVVPLVFASIIRGIAATENPKQLRSMGMRLAVYFLFTTTIAVTLGILIATVLNPGAFIDTSALAKDVGTQTVEQEINGAPLSLETIPESVISIFPENPLNAAVETNMLQVVLFSIIIGLALVSLKAAKSKPLLDLLGSLQSVAMAVVRWTMLIAPLAVFGLMAQLVIKTGIASLFGVGVYVLTVLVALSALLAVYLVLAYVFGGFSPKEFLQKVKEVQLLAFSTGSSAAVMPLSIKTVEEKLNIRPSISQFVIPIGATVNMDATALFQGVATVFLTQVYGIDLGLGMLIVLILTVVGSSIGAPATPGVGIIILSVVLRDVGIPLEGVALIIGVDRVLEMMRTSINVTGDLVASVVMDRLTRIKRKLTSEVADHERMEQKRRAFGRDALVGPEYSS